MTVNIESSDSGLEDEKYSVGALIRFQFKRLLELLCQSTA